MPAKPGPFQATVLRLRALRRSAAPFSRYSSGPLPEPCGRRFHFAVAPPCRKSRRRVQSPRGRRRAIRRITTRGPGSSWRHSVPPRRLTCYGARRPTSSLVPMNRNASSARGFRTGRAKTAIAGWTISGANTRLVRPRWTKSCVEPIKRSSGKASRRPVRGFRPPSRSGPPSSARCWGARLFPPVRSVERRPPLAASDGR